MVGGSQEEALNRFSKLLQPIRDLASNWNIDIAGEWGPHALLRQGRAGLRTGPGTCAPWCLFLT